MSAIKKEVIIGDCRLILGDCLEVMPLLEKVDAVVTDPPYFGREDLFPTNNVADMLSEIRGMPAFIFWPWYGSDPIENPDAVHIWHKSIPIHPNSKVGEIAGHHYERIFCYGLGNKSKVFRIAAILPKFAACADEFSKHPTQKPIAIVHDLMKNINAKTILDPFMGSGTTLVACAKLGRKGIGIELDPDYFEIAVERVQKAYDQPDLFVAPPAKPTQEGFDL